MTYRSLIQSIRNRSYTDMGPESYVRYTCGFDYTDQPAPKKTLAVAKLSDPELLLMIRDREQMIQENNHKMIDHALTQAEGTDIGNQIVGEIGVLQRELERRHPEQKS